MSYMVPLFALLIFLHLCVYDEAVPVPGEQDTSAKTDTIKESDLLEGDMIMDQNLFNIITNQTVDSKRGATTNGVRLWPNGVVPYVISRKLSTKAQRVIQEAMAELHNSTCIHFKPRTNEYYYVKFIEGNGCYSYVGRQYSGQVISIGPGCELVGTALHEMLHALGFFHTSSRADRDFFVKIFQSNIASGKAHNFQKYSHGDIDHLNSPYDITSIMHLPRYAFAKSPGLVTIQARAGAHIKLGETDKLSPVDKYQINALYKCSSSTSSSSCLTALGLQNGVIPDSSIKASSHSLFYQPSTARLYQKASKYGKGAWCPLINKNSWLEIDLGQIVRITGIATQGHYDIMSLDEYTPSYDLKYKTSFYGPWNSYTSFSRAYGGTQSLPGNWDGWSVQYNALDPTLYARYVRLYPKSWVKRPCFRVELYGCKY